MAPIFWVSLSSLLLSLTKKERSRKNGKGILYPHR
nr:MAG TPA: hypothetical protein [Caudoviricetes sp.]